MTEVSEMKIPKHVAIIMDGNGRWAEAQEPPLPRSVGHLVGYESAKNLVLSIFKTGVEVVTVYAFSTENWARAKEEVNYLFEIFQRAVEDDLPKFSGENIRIRFIGNRENLADRGFSGLVESMERIEQETARNTQGTFVVAINYGGRDEIVHVVKELIRLGVHPSCINERTISRQLYTAGLPDPDLIIRTAGEERISGFELWQSEYSEFYSTKTLWPDFKKKHFMTALRSYQRRKRKRGHASPEAMQAEGGC